MKMVDGGHWPYRNWLNGNNSAIDCPLLLKFGRAYVMGFRRLWLKPKTTDGTFGLKWQCSANCYY